MEDTANILPIILKAKPRKGAYSPVMKLERKSDNQRIIDMKQNTEVVDKRTYRIKKVQQFYSEDDCNPVWLKMGARDKLFYYGTVLLMAYGLGDSVYVLYLLALPK
ncbi:unnamed protein product [Brassicogethes aeneus]|uniref:Uncharacterized protein n=1 Tax=Brassicogethes aeneus TaxID=1431903 RepID=A0A9P0AQG1_BRAAE|nr:unnamed protein product [Brassicogethes aeneus]